MEGRKCSVWGWFQELQNTLQFLIKKSELELWNYGIKKEREERLS